MTVTISGNVHLLGDDIDTDRIIAGKYTKNLDLDELAAHVLEDIDPGFAARIRPGDILVAGSNFGCGSSREQAPLALKQAGIAAVVAASFARLFFRNAVNIALPALEIGAHTIRAGSRLEISLQTGEVADLTTGVRYQSASLSPVERAIFAAGGLAPFLAAQGGYGEEAGG